MIVKIQEDEKIEEMIPEFTPDWKANLKQAYIE
jgi:hypothetical protein